MASKYFIRSGNGHLKLSVDVDEQYLYPNPKHVLQVDD